MPEAPKARLVAPCPPKALDAEANPPAAEKAGAATAGLAAVAVPVAGPALGAVGPTGLPARPALTGPAVSVAKMLDEAVLKVCVAEFGHAVLVPTVRPPKP